MTKNRERPVLRRQHPKPAQTFERVPPDPYPTPQALHDHHPANVAPKRVAQAVRRITSFAQTYGYAETLFMATELALEYGIWWTEDRLSTSLTDMQLTALAAAVVAHGETIIESSAHTRSKRQDGRHDHPSDALPDRVARARRATISFVHMHGYAEALFVVEELWFDFGVWWKDEQLTVSLSDLQLVAFAAALAAHHEIIALTPRPNAKNKTKKASKKQTARKASQW